MHVSVDEFLIGFNGRFKWLVHIRGKPESTGLKIYGLADERSYLYQLKLYKGQHETAVGIVLSLLHELPNSHFKVYVDVWYGSDDLAFALLRQGLYFTWPVKRISRAVYLRIISTLALLNNNIATYSGNQIQRLLPSHFMTEPSATSSPTNFDLERLKTLNTSRFRHRFTTIDNTWVELIEELSWRWGTLGT